MFRPNNLKVFEPLNPEHALLDSFIQEAHEAHSTVIEWWFINTELTKQDMDNLDILYGATSSVAQKKMDGPYRVYAMSEINPIMMELSRMGLEQVEEIDLFVNQAGFAEYADNRIPTSGDIFRLTYMKNENDRRYVYYTVSNVIPSDLFNFRYTNWQVLGEQTSMQDVPLDIVNYIAVD